MNNDQKVEDAAAGQLRSFVERIELVNSEIHELREDLKDIFAEARGTGFDTKVMKKVIALRKKDSAERQEEEAILDLYCSALGMSSPRLPEIADRVQRKETRPKRHREDRVSA